MRSFYLVIWDSLSQALETASVQFDICTHISNHCEQSLKMTFKVTGPGHSANHISQTIGCKELVLTCTPK